MTTTTTTTTEHVKREIYQIEAFHFVNTDGYALARIYMGEEQ